MSLVEKRYAEALLDIAIEQNAIDAFLQDLKAFADIYSGEPEFKAFLLNPKNETTIKKSCCKKSF